MSDAQVCVAFFAYMGSRVAVVNIFGSMAGCLFVI